jgi:hypothetical protein
MPRRTDIWRIGIVHAPLEAILSGGLADRRIDWQSVGPDFTFLADPFGLWRDGVLHLFAESFDYRERHGRIELLRFDADLMPVDRQVCLSEPWHLSYPFVFEAEGETWMLPEAHRSGGLHFYRAVDFPLRWERLGRIALDAVAVDATPLWHDGLWWLLYCSAASKQSKIGELHLSFAEKLDGPWHPHPLNPVRISRADGRPGGTPIRVGGALMMPMQDCTRTYGGGIRMLRIDRMTPDAFDASPDVAIQPRGDFAPFVDGLHTLSACGGVTLIDAKRIDRGLGGIAIDAQRWLERFRGRWNHLPARKSR